MIKRLSALLISISAFAAMPTMAEGDAARGEQLSSQCAACHGADGNSVNPAWPKLAGQGEKYLLKQLKDVQSGERNIPEMTGIVANLSDQDLEDLSAYYAQGTMQLSGANADDAELLADGQALFRGGDAERGVAACIGCHSPTGMGNAPAGFPRLSGQHADYIAAQLTKFRTGADDPANAQARTNDGDSRMMRDVAATLSDRQIRALANYIAGVH